jgi:hypothetical protein
VALATDEVGEPDHREWGDGGSKRVHREREVTKR